MASVLDLRENPAQQMAVVQGVGGGISEMLNAYRSRKMQQRVIGVLNDPNMKAEQKRLQLLKDADFLRSPMGQKMMYDEMSGQAALNRQYQEARVVKLQRDATTERPMPIRTETGTGLYWPSTGQFKSAEELAGGAGGELIPADTELEGAEEDTSKPSWWDRLWNRTPPSETTTTPALNSTSPGAPSGSVDSRAFRGYPQAATGMAQAKPSQPSAQGVAPLMPFDVVDLAKNLDPASKAQLMQIIREGDPAKMKTAYERLKAKYGSVR